MIENDINQNYSKIKNNLAIDTKDEIKSKTTYQSVDNKNFDDQTKKQNSNLTEYNNIKQISNKFNLKYNNLKNAQDENISNKDNISESSENKNYQILFKIILIGDSGIGKTSLINQYINSLFSEKYLCTIGVDFMMKSIEIEETVIKLQIWDTAGMERYRNITTSYYRGANAAIMAFDLSNRKSFENLKYWINLYLEHSNQIISKMIVIVGNKADLESKKQVSKEDIEELMKTNPSFIYFEVSAKSGLNVELLFQSIAEKLYSDLKINGLADLKDRRNTGSYKSISTGDFVNILKKSRKCKC